MLASIVRCQGYTNSNAKSDDRLVNDKGVPDCGDDAAAQTCRIICGIDSGHDDRELIAPDSGHQVARSENSGNSAGKRSECSVPYRVTICIIYVLESIEIENEDGKLL